MAGIGFNPNAGQAQPSSEAPPPSQAKRPPAINPLVTPGGPGAARTRAARPPNTMEARLRTTPVENPLVAARAREISAEREYNQLAQDFEYTLTDLSSLAQECSQIVRSSPETRQLENANIEDGPLVRVRMTLDRGIELVERLLAPGAPERFNQSEQDVKKWGQARTAMGELRDELDNALGRNSLFGTDNVADANSAALRVAATIDLDNLGIGKQAIAGSSTKIDLSSLQAQAAKELAARGTSKAKIFFVCNILLPLRYALARGDLVDVRLQTGAGSAARRERDVITGSDAAAFFSRRDAQRAEEQRMEEESANDPYAGL